MRYIRVIITAVLLFTVMFCHTDASARQIRRSNTNPGDPVIGQVTIRNVDSADDGIMLNGAHIKIVNKDTGEEFTEVISDNGTLVYQLPWGSYMLTQVLAPNEYELNSKVYEFTLQLPENQDASNIRIVNASITMTNDYIAEEPAPFNESAGNDPGWADTATTRRENYREPAYGEEPSEELMSADKNPVTADHSNILLAIAVFSFIILTGGLIAGKRITDRLY